MKWRKDRTVYEVNQHKSTKQVQSTSHREAFLGFEYPDVVV